MQSKPFAPREINAHLLHQIAPACTKQAQDMQKRQLRTYPAVLLVEVLQRRQATLTCLRGHLSQNCRRAAPGMFGCTFPASEPEKSPACTDTRDSGKGPCHVRHPPPPSSMHSQQSGETLVHRRVSWKADARTQPCKL